MQGLAVWFNIFTINQNIVQVYNHSIIQQFEKDIIYYLLKCTGCITKTKYHSVKLEYAIVTAESSFGATKWVNW